MNGRDATDPIGSVVLWRENENDCAVPSMAHFRLCYRVGGGQ